MSRITSETLKRWRQQGVEDNQSRCYIFNNEWEALCDLALQSFSLESVRSEALLEKCAVLFETFAEHGMIAYAHGEKSPNAILCESAAKELRALQSRKDVHSTELRK